MRKTIQTKECLQCEKNIVRTYQNNQHWIIQKTHGGNCQNKYNRKINMEYKQSLLAKRFFKNT